MSLPTPPPIEAVFGQFVPGGPKPVVAMLEVTNRCNMSCHLCYSDANQYCGDVSISEIRRRLVQLLDLTGSPIPVQISGGEPTVRDDLPEIVSLARGLGYRNIEIITNGINLCRKPDLLPELKEKGVTAVFLQFDGMTKETYLAIRGQDMTEIRHRALEAVRNEHLCCTLAVALTRGINDGEVGEIVRFGIENIDTVRAVSFQSSTRFTGRFDLSREYEGYSMPALLDLIEMHTGIAADTFRSEHVGHPSCNAMSYVFLVDGRVEPLFKYISAEDMLNFLGEDRREKVIGLYRGKKEFFHRYLSNPEAWKLIAKAAPIFGHNPLNVITSKHSLIFAKSFMERHALDPERIRQCCYAITDTMGVFSLCAFNNLYRFRQPTSRQAGAGRS